MGIDVNRIFLGPVIVTAHTVTPTEIFELLMA